VKVRSGKTHYLYRLAEHHTSSYDYHVLYSTISLIRFLTELNTRSGSDDIAGIESLLIAILLKLG
jgi:hypothetical protein